jgi:SNF2 family DNA or RNA helicase
MKIYPEHKKVVIPYRADIENLLGSHAQRIQVNDGHYLAVPHDVDSTLLLRNVGIAVPSPVQYYYDWPGRKPFDSQRATADLLTVSRRAYVLSEMGVGKTSAVLYAYDYLRSVGKIDKLLVVAPLSTLVTVWENEIFENFPHLKAVVLYGSRKRREQLLSGPADIYIVNHEGVEVLHGELWKRTDISGVVIDEIASYRNSRAVRWKNLEPLVRRAAYAWGLTGSPTPNEPSDAYGQAKLLTPESSGRSFKSFKERTMRQVSAFRWVAREEANDIVSETLRPSVRFTRAACLDLPETTYTTRQVAIDPQAGKLYKKMCDELVVQVRSKQVSAANEGVKLSKLLQLSAGFVYDAESKGHYIGGLSRFRELFAIIEEAPSDSKFIVFASFRHFVELLGGVLRKRYNIAVVHGGTPKAERDRIYVAFQRTSEYRIIVAHPQCMAHGLTLTAANTIVWATPITSLEIYEQANARITRASQTKNTHIIHIQSTQAEKHVYDRLRRKGKMQGALLELLEDCPESAGSA